MLQIWSKKVMKACYAFQYGSAFLLSFYFFLPMFESNVGNKATFKNGEVVQQ